MKDNDQTMKEDLRVLSVSKIEEMILSYEQRLQRTEGAKLLVRGELKILREIKEMLLSNPSAQDIWDACYEQKEFRTNYPENYLSELKFHTLEDYLETIKLK